MRRVVVEHIESGECIRDLETHVSADEITRNMDPLKIRVTETPVDTGHGKRGTP